MRHFLIMGLLLCACSTLWGQVPDSLFREVKVVHSDLEAPERDRRKFHRAFRRLKSQADYVRVREEVTAGFSEQGYTAFSIDTFEIRGDSLLLSVHRGPQLVLDSLSVDGLGEQVYHRAGLDKLSRSRRAFDLEDLQARLDLCLQEYEHIGYPFAHFDSLELAYTPGTEDSVLVHVHYNFEPGKLVVIDSVLVEGDVRETDAFVRNMIGIFPGDAFDQEAIDKAPRRLNNSIYFKNVKAPEVEFTDEEHAIVRVDVESRKAGKFDLLIGILPPRDETAKLEFTGLADFQLVSPLFRAGEILSFRFDKLVGSSQKMHLDYTQPYLFSSPLEVRGEFDLLKQDTTFLTRFFRLSTGYSLTPNLKLRLNYKSKTSTLIATQRWEEDSSTVPPVLDGKDQTYGLGFEFNSLDYRFNPTKGWVVEADFGIGRKRIIENPKLHEKIYEDLITNLGKREAIFKLEYYRRYGKRWVLKMANFTYWLDQEQYFENDLLRAGGSRSIRGFDENQFFADFLTQFTIENRFLLEQNSYLFVFSDYAYLENRAGSTPILRPWGIGIGMTYETRAGMVSVTYASGKVGDFSFQPSRGRIHVGLINQF